MAVAGDPGPRQTFRMNPRRYTLAGAILTAVAGLGFLTVADDFRHRGEFFAVLGVLFSGLALLLAGLHPRGSAVLAPQWIPLGIALGEVAGAAFDRVPTGVMLGTALGILLARQRRERATDPAETSATQE